MAKTKHPILFFSLLLLFLLSRTASISDTDLDAAIAALRFFGYHLFGNAITVSDVRLDLLLSNASYTLFAPTDATLFSLDMAASSAGVYVTALRYHIALGRFPHAYLLSLTEGTALHTLVPHRDILISRRKLADSDIVSVDGVDVVLPGLFYGQDLVVHGLDGILPLHRKRLSAQASNVAPRSPDSRIYPSVSPTPGLSPSISPDLSPLPSISPASRLSPSISPAAEHSPSISPVSGLFPPVSPISGLSPSISPDLSPSPSISLVYGHSPSISPIPRLSPAISPDSNPSPSISPVFRHSPSISPTSGLPPSIKPDSSSWPSISPVSGPSPSVSTVRKRSPSISPVSRHSPSMLPDSELSPSVSPAWGLSPSISPVSTLPSAIDSNLAPLMAPDSSVLPSMAPESGQLGLANPSDLWSPVVSPVVNVPCRNFSCNNHF